MDLKALLLLPLALISLPRVINVFSLFFDNDKGAIFGKLTGLCVLICIKTLFHPFILCYNEDNPLLFLAVLSSKYA